MRHADSFIRVDDFLFDGTELCVRVRELLAVPQQRVRAAAAAVVVVVVVGCTALDKSRGSRHGLQHVEAELFRWVSLSLSVV